MGRARPRGRQRQLAAGDAVPGWEHETGTPTQAGTYYVGFWVKNAGSTPANGSYDASITATRTVTSGSSPCTNAALGSNPNAQTLGVNTSMLFTASATCGGTANYSWWVGQDLGGGNVNWQQVTQFQAGNTILAR